MKIAIIDSGVDKNHKRLKNCRIQGMSIVRNSSGFKESDDFSDEFGHGTGVAAIIHKKHPEAELIGIKVFHEDLITTEENICEAIRWCIDNEIDIINLSLGVRTTNPKKELHTVCKLAFKNNIIVIAAAYHVLKEECYPAYFPEVFGVTCGNIKNSSEFGYIKNSAIEFIAKGTTQRVADKDGGYKISDGTSYACAYLTGIVASYLIENPSKQNISELKNDLIKKCNPKVVPFQPKHTNTSIPLVVRHDLNDIADELFNQEKKFGWLRNLALFPVSEKEMKTFFDFPRMCKFNVRKYLDYPKALSSREFVKFGNTFQIQDWMLDDEDFDKIDSLVLGYFYEHLFQANVRFGYNLLTKAIEKNKNIFCYDGIMMNFIKQKIKETGSNSQYYFPGVSNSHYEIVKHFRYQKSITTPVLSLIGTSNRQGKFTTQLRIKEILENEGYNVAHISTEPHGELFGAVYSFPFGHNSTIDMDRNSWSIFLRALLNAIESVLKPHIVITGTQGWTIPRAFHLNPTGQELNALEFLFGIQPDAVVCAINPNDPIEVIKKHVDSINTLTNAKVLFYVMTPWLRDFNKNDGGKIVNNFRFLSKVEIADKLLEYQSILNAPVFDIMDESNNSEILNLIQNYYTR